MGFRKRISIGIIIFMFFISSAQLLSGNHTFNQFSIKTIKSSSSSDSWSMFGGGSMQSGSLDTTPNTNTSANWNLTNVYPSQSYTLPNLWISTPTIDDGIIAESSNISICLINETTGRILWNTSYTCTSSLTYSDFMPNQYYYYSAMANGRVYVSNPWTNQIFCINTSTYNVDWNITLPNPVYSSPMIYNGLIYVGAYNGTMYCLYATNGSIDWANQYPNLQNPGQITITPTVSGGVVYYVDNNNGIFGLWANDGSLFLNYSSIDHFGKYGPIIGAGDKLFTEDDKGNLYCLDSNTGVLDWLYTVNGNNSNSVPAFWNNEVFIDSSNYTYCINYDTGSLTWSHFIGDNILSSPVISNGYVYLTGGNGTLNQNIATDGIFNGSTYLYCLNATDGSFLWKFKGYDKGLFACTPAIADGNVFIDDGYFLYSIPMNLISTTVPSAPFGLVSSIFNNSATVFLSWNPPVDNGYFAITGYNIYRGTTPDNESYVTSVAGNVLCYTDTGLKDNQIYYYTVSANNSAGESPKSEKVSITTPVELPSKPLYLFIGQNGNNFILSWTPPVSDGGSNITGYNIYRSTSSGNEIFIATVGNVHSYTDVGLKPGQIYYYQVSAINSVGEGPKSAETSINLENKSLGRMTISAIVDLSLLGLIVVVIIIVKKTKE